uniref:Putative ovule protein n=1 Tax=Solanum chacoense TaxID=4108 RepID=A0A0V0GQ73_SOLCH
MAKCPMVFSGSSFKNSSILFIDLTELYYLVTLFQKLLVFYCVRGGQVINLDLLNRNSTKFLNTC